MLRLATYNFLGGGSAKRSGHWRLIRERLAPDLFFGQECRPPATLNQVHAALWRRAPGRVWGSGLYLSRGSIRRIPLRGFGGWVIGGELDSSCWVSERPLRAFSIHCPAGEQGYVKTMGVILDRLAPVARGADLVLGGDYNVAAGVRGPLDRVRMGNAERALLARLADDFGLIPCWQAMHPGVALEQTLRWTGNRAIPYHCDGLFVPARWRPRLRSCEIVSGPEWDALSDHNPVVAVLD